MEEKELVSSVAENVIYNLSDALLHAREAKAHAEQGLKDCNAIVDELELQLIEQMTNGELSSFKRNSTQFSLVTKSHISAEPERKDELWEQMKSQGYDHLFSINAQTLSGEVKRLIEENYNQLPTWLDGLVKQYDKPSIRIRK